MSKLHSLILGGALLIGLAAAAPTAAQIPDQDAQVERLVVNSDGTITVYGSLPNPCYQFLPPGQRRSGSTITISLRIRAAQNRMCAQVISPFEHTIVVDVTGLAAGAYTVVVNGVSASLSVSQGVPDQPTPSASDCITRLTRHRSYQDNQAGFCLLYPRGFKVVEPDDTNTSITIVPQITTPRGVVLALSHEPAAGRTLDDIAEAQQAEHATLAITFEPTTIGGQPAIVTDDLPGARASRQAFVIASDRLYRLVLESDRTGQQQADDLWKIVTESLIFFTPESSETEADAR